MPKKKWRESLRFVAIFNMLKFFALDIIYNRYVYLGDVTWLWMLQWAFYNFTLVEFSISIITHTIS